MTGCLITRSSFSGPLDARMLSFCSSCTVAGGAAAAGEAGGGAGGCGRDACGKQGKGGEAAPLGQRRTHEAAEAFEGPRDASAGADSEQHALGGGHIHSLWRRGLSPRAVRGGAARRLGRGLAFTFPALFSGLSKIARRACA